ncbi:MAG: hypothetical protein K1Y36_28295 [Blastocatellia bacterium]|nr:hypothetical protein [Blastocatellia bacterium]
MRQSTLSEFLVDGVGLSTLFNFDFGRPWFGRTCFEEGPASLEKELLALRGLGPAWNQFGTGRFVLYRCHCGCDYCGVISCQVIRTATTVIWKEIQYEDDWFPNLDPPFEMRIPLFEFDLEQYESALDKFLTDRPAE